MNVLKRLEKVERELKKTLPPKWLAVIRDTDGHYRGACDNDLTQQQYESWLNQQDEDIRLIRIEITENKARNPAGGETN